jgi:anti-anti-sigma factor
MCSDQVSPVAKGSMGRLSILTRVESGRHTFRLHGELDIASAPILDASLADACTEGAEEVVVDMGGIEFMDSAGLRTIIRGRKLCETHQCTFALTPAQRPVQKVFESTNLLKRLSSRRAG